MQLHSGKGKILVREALPADLPALVSIHVTSWNVTYRYYFRNQQSPYAFSNGKGISERAHNWTCFVAEQEVEIAGFVTCHDFQDHNLPYKGQLDKIHILKSY